MIHNQHWWKRLLLLKDFVQMNDLSKTNYLALYASGKIVPGGGGDEADTICLVFDKEILTEIKNNFAAIILISKELQQPEILKINNLDKNTITILQLYIPYAMLPYYSNKYRRTFSIAHLTQSVDGRIATVNGHSKWIGNEEDLLHVHCMRSLCDAVIVGNNTVRLDEPKLTVRNVEGPSPIKIIIGNSKSNLESLLNHNAVPVISLSNQSLYTEHAGVQEIIFEGNKINTGEILDALFKKGINSVYIEGGANTISCFVKEKTIDSLQIHIANKILGSGKSSVSLDEIETIDECITLSNTRHYLLGDEILMVSNL